MKKTISLLIALVLVLSLAVTSVFATDPVNFDNQNSPYSFSASGSGTFSQNYELTDGGFDYTDVTQVDIEWEIQNICVNVQKKDKVWDPKTLTWTDATAGGQTNGITVTPGSATFTITNDSSVKVDASIQFAPETQFATNATWSFNNGTAKAAYSTTLNTKVNSDKTVQTGTAPSCTVTASVTTSPNDFKNLPATAGAKFGTYTVTITSSATQSSEKSNDTDENDDKPYLTFTGNDTFTFSTKQAGTKTWEGSLEIAVSDPEKAESWTDWDGNSIQANSDTHTIYLRGKNTTLCRIEEEIENYTQFVFGGNATAISCSGNIMILLDYTNPDSAVLSESCFDNLFKGCDKLTSAPSLPATTLADFCYNRMFRGCTALTKAPALPATTLSAGCYNEMFRGCTSLKISDTGGTAILTVPADISNGVVDNMFSGISDSTPETPEAGKTYYYLP